MAEVGMVGNVRAFLRAVECSSLQELEDLLDDRLEPAFVKVRGIGRFASEGVEVQVQSAGTGVLFPFSVHEFWSAVDDLELEDLSTIACDELASQISDVEGFDVTVMVTYDVDESLLKPRHRRTMLDSGVAVQVPSAYPYRSPMGGRKTFAEWRSTRFNRHYPGLEPTLCSAHDEAPDTTPLALLRG